MRIEEEIEEYLDNGGTEDPYLFEKLDDIIACLRALQLQYQHWHWMARGESFQGDHELYADFYYEAIDQIDELGEILLAVLDVGREFTPVTHVDGMSKYTDEWSKIDDPVDRLLAIERYLISRIDDLIDEFDETDADLPTGVEDLLVEISRDHQNHVYRLRRRRG